MNNEWLWIVQQLYRSITVAPCQSLWTWRSHIKISEVSQFSEFRFSQANNESSNFDFCVDSNRSYRSERLVFHRRWNYESVQEFQQNGLRWMEKQRRMLRPYRDSLFVWIHDGLQSLLHLQLHLLRPRMWLSSDRAERRRTVRLQASFL